MDASPFYQMKPHKYSIIVFLLLVACGEKTDAPTTAVRKVYENPPIRITQIIAPEIINIAQTLNVEYQIDYPENYQVEFPELPNEHAKFGEFTVRSKNIAPAKLTTKNNLQQILTLRLSPFLAGDYEITQLAFKFTDAQKSISTIATEIFTIKILPIIASDETAPQLREIIDIKNLPTNWRLWIMVIVVAIIILAILFYWWRQRKNKIIAPIEIPPHLLALRAIDVLEKSDLLPRQQYKDFYAALSDILRRYIEQRFAICAPEQTTEEFLNALSVHHDFSTAHRQLLINFLSYCDLVKFAKHQPTLNDAHSAITSSREFINNTTIITN